MIALALLSDAVLALAGALLFPLRVARWALCYVRGRHRGDAPVASSVADTYGSYQSVCCETCGGFIEWRYVENVMVIR